MGLLCKEDKNTGLHLLCFRNIILKVFYTFGKKELRIKKMAGVAAAVGTTVSAAGAVVWTS